MLLIHFINHLITMKFKVIFNNNVMIFNNLIRTKSIYLILFYIFLIIYFYKCLMLIIYCMFTYYNICSFLNILFIIMSSRLFYIIMNRNIKTSIKLKMFFSFIIIFQYFLLIREFKNFHLNFINRIYFWYFSLFI